MQVTAQSNNVPEHSWNYTDSISGGVANIILDKQLENLIRAKEKSVCVRDTPKQPTIIDPATRCAKQNKIMGYKIQIFYTKDRNAANKVMDDFRKSYPNLTPELIYASPDYRILVGDYFTRSSANNDLRSIKRNYAGAFAVQYRVWCRKAI